MIDGAMRAAETPRPTDGADLRVDGAELSRLSDVLAPKPWLRGLGLSAWFLLGIVLLLAVVFWVTGQASAIVLPVLAGAVVATVGSPLVTRLERRGVNRIFGSIVVLLALIVVAVFIAFLVISGIVGQSDEISSRLSQGLDHLTSWAKSAGVDSSGADKAAAGASSATHLTVSNLVHGILTGAQGIASLALGLSFAVFAVFFLLKDGPRFHAWLNAHLGLPPSISANVVGNVIISVRRYFLGVTIVAAFNGVVVTLGALILGVPLAGTIGVVTFVTAYIPFIGAFVSGAFAVLLALGAKGTTTALIMLVIVILANGTLQNIVQPIAFGATLDLNPLLILVLTIGFGSLFGMAGLVLAAPLAAATSHVAQAFAQARAAPP
jgi:putative heme transporter